MKKFALFVACSLMAAIALLVSGADANQASNHTPPPFSPVMPVHHVMIEQERHFSSLIDLLRDESAKERDGRLIHAALALAEMANINAYQEHAAEHADYREWTNALKGRANQFSELIKAKSYDDARRLAGEINRTCKSCHDKYQ